MPDEHSAEQQVEPSDSPVQYKVKVENPVAIVPPEAAEAQAESVRVKARAYPIAGAPVAPAKGKTAILVCHGMGQQVQFSTLNSVVNALLRAPGSRLGDVEVQMIRTDDGQLPRAVLHNPDDKKREVHLYEAYWAVLTEGKISGTDVMKFLIGAGWEGIRAALKPFERWMFDDWQQLPRARALTHLLVAVAVVCSIALYGYAFIVAAGAKTLSVFGVMDSGLPLPDALISHVFAFLFALLGVLLIVAGLMLVHKLLALFTNKAGRRQPPLTLRIVNLATAVLLLLAAAPTGLSLLYHLYGLLAHGPAWFDRNSYAWLGQIHDLIPRLPADHRVLYLLLWIVAAAAVYAGRWFLVEYVGDVAIYVTAYKVNKFQEVRQQIKDVGLKVAIAVYEARDLATGNFEYEDVIVVGHSLGSVVAYDTLNAMINRDLSRGEQLRVVRRTKALITFGSPLDKTAFLFRTQTDREDVRESLAAAVQPLIRSYRFRPNRWINIFSRLDWISGALEYYDAPSVRSDPDDPDHGKTVRNVEDLEAIFPLYAHTQYWGNKLFSEILYQEVMRGAANDEDAPQTD